MNEKGKKNMKMFMIFALDRNIFMIECRETQKRWKGERNNRTEIEIEMHLKLQKYSFQHLINFFYSCLLALCHFMARHKLDFVIIDL